MTDVRILLADDDPMIVDALSYQLEKEGFTVLKAYDGQEALELAREANPRLILLDVMMPKLQGWEVCRILRQEGNTTPILMLTARGEEMDRVLGLELGADDYVVKPFNFRELLARIRANLRRVDMDNYTATQTRRQPIVLGHLVIDPGRHLVTRNGQPVALSHREYDLLMALLEADGTVLKRGELLDKVWGEDWIGDPRTLDVHIRWLREKLEEDPSHPQLIRTVRGVGYRLVSPDELETG